MRPLLGSAFFMYFLDIPDSRTFGSFRTLRNSLYVSINNVGFEVPTGLRLEVSVLSRLRLRFRFSVLPCQSTPGSGATGQELQFRWRDRGMRVVSPINPKH